MAEGDKNWKHEAIIPSTATQEVVISSFVDKHNTPCIYINLLLNNKTRTLGVKFPRTLAGQIGKKLMELESQ